MNCYQDLSSDNKYILKCRIVYIHFLILLNTYNVVVLSSLNLGWFLIPITIANFLSICNSLLHIFLLIKNRNDYFFIFTADVIYNFSIIGDILVYLFTLVNNNLYNQYEFAVFIVYMTIFFTFIIYSIIILCYLSFRKTQDLLTRDNQDIIN